MSNFVSFCCHFIILIQIMEGNLKKYTYNKGSLIGTGTFGQVLKCENKETKQKVAIKITEIHEDPIILSFDHPNIVKIHEILYADKYQYIVMDLYRSNFRKTRRQNLQRRFYEYFVQVIKGVQYLHARGLAHGDIKDNNIFYSFKHSKPIVVVGDFSNLKLEPKKQDFQKDIYCILLMMIKWLTGVSFLGVGQRYPSIDDLLASVEVGKALSNIKNKQIKSFIQDFLSPNMPLTNINELLKQMEYLAPSTKQLRMKGLNKNKKKKLTMRKNKKKSIVKERKYIFVGRQK